MSGFYDPDTGTIGAETGYDWFHEYAHQDQHARGSLLFALRLKLVCVPVASYVLNAAVEADASARALIQLWTLGILEWRDVSEAWKGFRTHLFPISLNRPAA